MSSAGQVIGGVVGAIAGFLIAGPTGAIYGAQIGVTAGGIIDPPKGPNIRGPRLHDLSAQTSSYGVPLPRIYGTMATLGNVFWLENDQLKEVEKKKKSGGKGGPESETTSYSYYATFAVGICKGPIAGVRRIWVSGKLIYDAGSDDLGTIIASNQAAEGFSIYLGTDDQEPDPRMQADRGVANTPAFRGRAYIVFYDFALADYGNSLMAAQVKVEAVAGDATVPAFFSWAGSGENAGYSDGLYTTATYSSVVSAAITKTITRRFLDGSVHSVETQRMETIDADNQMLVFPCINDTRIDFCRRPGAGTANVSAWYFNGAPVTRPVRPPIGTDTFYAIDSLPVRLGGYVYATGGNNAAWLARWPVNSSSPDAYYNLSANGFSGNGDDFHLSVSDDDSIYVFAGSGIRLAQFDQDLNLLRSWASVPFFSTSRAPFVYRDKIFGQNGLSSFGLYSFDDSSFTQIGSNYSITGTPDIAYVAPGVGLMVSPERGAVILTDTWSPDGVALSNILSDECLSASQLESYDIDVADIDEDVRGYRVTETGAIRAAIEPLQGAWPFDVVPSGYQIKFKRRGGASVATIPASHLDARPDGEAPGVQLTIAREMDSQIPQSVHIRHVDPNREYDFGEQEDDRPGTASNHIEQIELPIVMTATECKQACEVLLNLRWRERYDLSFRLPPEYRGLEPADVITITTDDASYELLLKSVGYLSDGRLECRAKYNSAAAYTSTAQGEDGNPPNQTLGLQGPSTYRLLDVPVMDTAQDAPGFLVAMTGYLDAWPGGILYRSGDDGQSWDDVQAISAPGAVMGTATNAIGAGRYDIIDAASILNANMLGDLDSVTELQMLNGANHFAYGATGRWEIIAAMNCVQQGDDSWNVSNLLRGRFGTEWAASQHVIGDALVLLDSAALAFAGVNVDTIDLPRLYRGITYGKTIDSDVDAEYTYEGVNLMPLSPVYLNGNRNPSNNNWTLTWIRRTRTGGAWRDYVDASLGEASESYEIEVYSNSGYTTVLRTLTATSQTVTYTSANQVTDFGSNQGTLYLKIYQLSATVGRGFPLTASITR